MSQKIKKHFFKILPISVVSLLIIVLAIGIYTNLPINFAHAAAINAATNVAVTPGTQFTTFKGVPVYRLHVANTGNAADAITSLSPTPSGSVNDTLITLHFYNDANDNGIVDQGDTDLLASAAFAIDDTIQAFDITDVTVPALGSVSILITADGTGALLNAETFTLSFAAGADILMSVAPTGAFPLTNGNALTISTSVPSLTIADAASNPVAKTVKASATNVAVKRLAISAAAGTSDSIVSLAPTPTGTENDNTNITSVVFYIDSGLTPGQVDGTDVQLVTTPATYSGDNTQTIFTFSSPVQIAASSTVNILIVYNLGAGVTNGNTLYTSIAATGDVVAGSGTALTSDTSTTSALITIDTVAPIGTVALSAPVINLAGTTQTVSVTYSEPMAATAPTIVFDFGTFVSTGPGGWVGNTYTESFTDSSFEEFPAVTVSTSGATDVALNPEGASIPGANNPFVLDTVEPIGTVALSAPVINLAGTTQTVSVTYSEPMAATAPTIVFDFGTFVSTGPGGWVGNTYTESFTDSSFEEFPAVTVSTSGATDVALNPEGASIPGANNPFVLDTVEPIGTVALSAPVINLAGTTQTVSVTYSEPMAATAPTIVFDFGTFVSTGPGGWVGNTYTESFTDSSFEEFPAVTVSTSGATDVALNPEGASIPGANNPFVLDTVEPIGTVALSAPVINLAGTTQTVSVTYSEPMAATAPTIVFDFGTFVSTGPGGWVGNTYTESFTDSSFEEFPAVTVSTSGATDVALNPEGASIPGANNPFVLDTVEPIGTVALSAPVINLAGTTQTVSVTYSEPMAATAPTIVFDFGTFVSTGPGGWVGNTYTESFTDSSFEEFPAVTVSTSGATDVALNPEGASIPGANNPFVLDTVEPIGTVALSAPVINLAGTTQTVSVTYSEPMAATAPTIVFDFGTFVSTGPGGWVGNTYTESFTDSSFEEFPAVTVSTSGATDVALNPEGASIPGANNPFVLDTVEPIGTVALSAPVINLAGTTQTVSVTYSEPMAATAPTIVFDFGTFVSTGPGGWVGNTYTESFTDSSFEEFPAVTVSTSGATDVALNPEGASIPGANNPFVLDTVEPIGTVALSAPVINLAGTTQTVSVTYSEPMAATAPTIVFDFGTFVSTGPGGWVGNTYTESFTDSSFEEFPAVTVSTSGATDVALNPEGASIPGANNPFVLDTVEPIGTVALSAPVINLAGTTQTVSVTYSEPMAATAPTIVFDFGTFVSTGPGGWDITGTIYTESFIDSSFEEFPVVNVTTSGATDAALNPEGLSILGVNDPFVLDTVEPTITAVEEFDINNDGMIDETMITFNEAISDASVAASEFTIGGTAADTFLATTSTNGTDPNVADDDTITIEVAAGVAGTEAKAVVYTAGSLTDLVGNSMATATIVVGSVTDSAAPVILSTVPADAATGVAVAANVVVTFSEPMDTIAGLTQTSAPDPGGWVVGWTLGDTVATFTHTNFLNNTAYTQQITAGQDLAALPLAGGSVANPWSFTTVAGGSSSTPPPTCTMTINSGAASTTSLGVTLNITPNKTVTEMAISNDSGFTTAVFEPYSATKSWTLNGLASSYGTKTVYVIVRVSGIASTACADSIEYIQAGGGGGGGGGGGAGSLPSTTPAQPSNLVLHDPEPDQPLPPTVQIGTLVKRADMSAVYFIDQDNRRHAFPNSAVYSSWYSDFSGVQTVSAETLAAIPLGSNVTARPGTWLVKIQSDPKVYAVEPYGVIRWVSTEQVALDLYGANWNSRIIDVDPTFFINYQVGLDISTSVHPTGSVIQYAGSSDLYYITNGFKQLITPAVFSSDLFQDKFVDKNIASTIIYTTAENFPSLPAETLMTLR